MIDQELRRLERLALEDPEARAKYFTLGIKHGLLAAEDLERALLLGDPGAEAALAETADLAPRPPFGVTDLAREIVGWGQQAVVRAGVALGDRLLPLARSELVSSLGQAAGEAAHGGLQARLEETRGWLRSGRAPSAGDPPGWRAELERPHYTEGEAARRDHLRLFAATACSEVPALVTRPEGLVLLSLVAAEAFYEAASISDRGIDWGAREAQKTFCAALLPRVFPSRREG